MKKYLLFGYNDYYPSGGMGDYLGDFNSLEDIEEYKIKQEPFYDNYEIVKYETMEEV